MSDSLDNVQTFNVGPEAAPESAVESTPAEAVQVDAHEEPTPQVDPADEFVARFTALSRKEKELLTQKEELKAHQTKLQEIESIQEKGVLGALEYHGFTLDDVLDHALGMEEQKTVDPTDKLREDFESYKRSIEEERAAKQAEADKINQQNIDEAVNAHKNQISSHLSQNTDKYELITSQKQQDLVWDVTEAHFESTGVLLSIEEAADKVETYLENQVREMLKLNKFKQQDSSPKSLELKDSIATGSKTLTKDNNSGIQVREKMMSREESLKHAAQALKWNN